MPISKKILNHLKRAKYKYEIIEHKTTYTAWDTAQTTQKRQKKIKAGEIAKTLVIKTDNNCILALVSANKILDKKKLLKTINALRKKRQKGNLKIKLVKKVELAKEAWMKKNIPGKVGATPPFQELTKCDIFIDGALARQKSLIVGSGEYEYSIRVPTGQYLKNEKPVKGNFSGNKKMG